MPRNKSLHPMPNMQHALGSLWLRVAQMKSDPGLQQGRLAHKRFFKLWKILLDKSDFANTFS
jgi:hypothetical protein